MSTRVLLLMIPFLFTGFNSYAGTVAASSCSKSDIETAIFSANTGDTVTVPAGDCIWTSTVTLSKEITLQGAGIDQTVIHQCGFRVSNGTDNIRITGFTFDGAGQSVGIKFGSGGGSGSKDFRIDHCKFTDYATRAIDCDGYNDGVIDHCQFVDVLGEGIVIHGDRDDAWSRPHVLGGSDGVVFIEDCTFALTGSGDASNVLDSNSGARWVFRYNTVTDNANAKWSRALECHGHCYLPPRGTVSYEIYENTFTSNTDEWKQMFCCRGGGGVVYRNTLTGRWHQGVQMKNYRSTPFCSSECINCDTRCCGENDYPCQDQIGVNDNLDLYIWDNINDGDAITVTMDSTGYTSIHIQENREYFLSQKSGYTPYEYPHPLTKKLSAPSKLRVVSVTPTP